jgi:hypothetical protein
MQRRSEKNIENAIRGFKNKVNSLSKSWSWHSEKPLDNMESVFNDRQCSIKNYRISLCKEIYEMEKRFLQNIEGVIEVFYSNGYFLP